MPGNDKKGPSNKVLAKIHPTKLRALWSSINVRDWLHILNNVHGGNKWAISGPRIMGLCPFHSDRSPSFMVNLEHKYAKCLSTNCDAYFWDPIRFYSQLHNLNYAAAVNEMKDRFSIRLPKTAIRELSKRQNRRDIKRMLHEITQGELIDASQPNAPPDLAYALNAVRYLTSRGISGVHHLLPLGVLPPKARLQVLVDQYVKLHNLKDRWADTQKYLEPVYNNSQWLGSVMFYTGASPEEICRIKVRQVPAASGAGFSTTAPKVTKYLPDDLETSNGLLGLYGIPPYTAYIAANDVDSCHVVEGEFDALAFHARQVATHNVGMLVFSGGGGSVDSMDVLREFGFNSGYLVGDNDDGGEGWVRQVLSTTLKLALRVYGWPAAMAIQGNDAPDPDDLINTFGLATVEASLRDPTNFEFPYKWAEARALQEMASIPEEDIRYLTNVAAKWGRFVRDPTEQQAYIQAVAAQHSINGGQVLTELVSGDENEEAFIERLRTVLASRLHILKRHEIGSQQKLQVWDIVTKCIYDLPLGDPKQLRVTLQVMMGCDIYQWVKENIGEPEFLEEYAGKGDIFYLRYEKALSDYATTAVGNLCANLPNQQEVKTLGAGYHTVVTEEGEMTAYLVNGMDLYKAHYDKDRAVWEKLAGPTDVKNNVVVYAEPGHWPRCIYPHIKNADDLNRMPSLTLSEALAKIREMVSAGWDFKNHEVTCDLVAALVLQIFISDALPRQILLMFNAEAQSGKSSLMGGLIGRGNLPSINIVLPALFMDNYTAAGVRQKFNHSTEACCLDEFEDTGGNDRRSVVCRTLLQLFRGLTNEDGLTVIGSTSGRHLEYAFRCPVITAGIRGLHTLEDLSRFIVIEMDRKATRSSPEAVLLRDFGKEVIQKLRYELPLLMYHAAKNVRDAYFDIYKRYQDGGALTKYKGMTRVREHYYGAMAIMEVCGRNSDEFIKDYYKAHQSHMKRLATSTFSEEIFRELISTPTIRTGNIGDIRPRTAIEILGGAEPNALNQSSSGLYYDPITGWLIVNWVTVKTAVLGSSEFRNKSASWLKNQAQRSVYHIKDRELEKSGVFKRLGPYMGRMVRDFPISAYNMNGLVSDITAKKGDATGDHVATVKAMPDGSLVLPDRTRIPNMRGFDEVLKNPVSDALMKRAGRHLVVVPSPKKEATPGTSKVEPRKVKKDDGLDY
jgi:hypothetical protein